LKPKRQRGQQPTLKRRWLDQETDGRSTPRSVKRQERHLGKLMGGRRRPGSGSNKLAPGDAVGRFELGEAKQTAAKSISIKRAWLAQIENEAAGEGRVPVFHLEWIGFEGDPECKFMTPGWAMVPDWYLAKLMEAYHAGDGDVEGSE